MQNKCTSEDGSLRSSEDGGSELTFSIVLGTVEGIKAIFSKFNLNALLESHFSRQLLGTTTDGLSSAWDGQASMC